MPPSTARRSSARTARGRPGCRPARCSTAPGRPRPASAAGHGPKAPGWAPRPRSPGDASWQIVAAGTYGKTRTVQAAVTGALWHGSFKDAPGQLVLVRDPGSDKPYDLALFTPCLAAAAAVTERYSWRWPIEPSNATAKQILGVGEAY